MQQRLDCARQALTEAQVTENGKDGMQTPCGVKVGDSTPPPAPVDEPPAKKARIDMEFIAADQLPGQSIATVPAAGLKKGKADQRTPDTMQVHFEFVTLSGACFEPLTMEVDGMTSCGHIFRHLNLESELGWRIVLPGDRVCDAYSKVLTAVTRRALSSGVVWVQVLQMLPETRKRKLSL